MFFTEKTFPESNLAFCEYLNSFQNFQTTFSDEATSLAGDRQVYTPCGFYKGCRVAIKRVDKQRIDLTRPLLLELKRMKDLEHDHLTR